MRRIRPALADEIVKYSDIEVDRVSHRVRRAGNEIHLGPTEFRLLDHLIQHPGRLFRVNNYWMRYGAMMSMSKRAPLTFMSEDCAKP